MSGFDSKFPMRFISRCNGCGEKHDPKCATHVDVVPSDVIDVFTERDMARAWAKDCEARAEKAEAALAEATNLNHLDRAALMTLRGELDSATQATLITAAVRAARGVRR
jgi:hypothetical protein